MKRSAFTTLGLAAVAAVLLVAVAQAKSPLGIGTAEPSTMPSGFGWQILAFINEQQQAFYRALTGALKAIRQDPSKLALLVGLSFAYGVFHAAGPGHGKAVISSYMIANEVALRRGILLSFLSSFLQGVTAILLVGAAYLLLRGTSVSMTDATRFMELASYLLIAFFGAWLLWRKIRPLLTNPSTGSMAHTHTRAHDFEHHAHDHGGHHHHNHEHSHQHDGEVCATCGHSHAPDPALISGRNFSLREAWSAVIAVGLRPCSGSLLVLSFALLNGLYIGGILSVFAISLGTAITVSALATMAVLAKDLALRFAGSERAATISMAIEIGGALLVLALGILLFTAAL